MVRVVPVDEIQDDGARLSQRDICVGILDRWQPAVRVDGHVGGPLDVAKGDLYDLMRDIELFENDRDLWRIGPTLSPDLDGLKSCDSRHGWILVVFDDK